MSAPNLNTKFQHKEKDPSNLVVADWRASKLDNRLKLAAKYIQEMIENDNKLIYNLVMQLKKEFSPPLKIKPIVEIA